MLAPRTDTFHTRVLVRSPSGLSLPVATAIFLFGLGGVVLNYIADKQRQEFREKDGKMQIWGRDPVFIKARSDLEPPSWRWCRQLAS